MKIKSLPVLALLVVSATSSAAAENVIALNARAKLTNIPSEVLAPPRAQAELSILRVDQRVEEGTVRFVVSMDRSLPPGRILVLYLDLGDEFVCLMYDAKKYLYSAVPSAGTSVNWSADEKKTRGYHLLPDKKVQCEAALTATTFSARTMSMETDYSLAGRTGRLLAFVIEGDDVWAFSPTRATTDRERFDAKSTVYEAEVKY